MRYSQLALAASMAISPTVAVGVADFPGCATECAVFSTQSPVDTGCTITNLKCVCASALYVKQVRSCLQNPPEGNKKCTPEEVQKTLNVSQQLCKQAGFELEQQDENASSTSATSDAAQAPAVASGVADAEKSGTPSAAGVADATADATTTDASVTGSNAAETSSVDASEGAAGINNVGTGLLALAGLVAAAL